MAGFTASYLERVARFELAPSRWQRDTLPTELYLQSKESVTLTCSRCTTTVRSTLPVRKLTECGPSEGVSEPADQGTPALVGPNLILLIGEPDGSIPYISKFVLLVGFLPTSFGA